MALSKVPDLTHTYRGQDYTFVDHLEDLKDLECPICRSIVSEPVLTSCGHLFCTECYKKLKVSKKKLGDKRVPCAQCPVCKQDSTTMQDYHTNRRVGNLKVRCMNHEYGCKWVGNLSDELQHRKTQGAAACTSEEIPCPHGCGKTLRRMRQLHHLNQCPMRPYKCKYCAEEGPYRNIEGIHKETCHKYPIQCPNGCRVEIPRRRTASYMMEAKLHDDKKRIQDLETKVEAKTERIHQLERENEAMAQCKSRLEVDTEVAKKTIRNLERDTKGQKEHIQRLERDISDKTEQLCDLERDTEVTKMTIRDLERDTKGQKEDIQRLKRDISDKTGRLHDLERETEEKTARISELECDTKAKTKCICGLERDTEAKTERIRDLESDVKAKTKCIDDHEKVAKAKAKHIRDLERVTSSHMQRLTELTAENSEQQKKMKRMKMFIVFALGVIVLFHLHPLYFIAIILLLNIVYA